MNEIPVVIAQTSAPGTPPATGGRADPVPFWAQPIFPILLIAVVFYLFLYRNKRTQDKQRTDMLSQLKRGDRIQTIGGILGTVTEVRDSEVVVKVDESSNTKLRFTRSAIHRVVEEEKAESK
jgi:preprotein translocase subunit YajC